MLVFIDKSKTKSLCVQALRLLKLAKEIIIIVLTSYFEYNLNIKEGFT